MTNLYASSPVVTLAPTLPEIEGESAGKTLSNVEAKAVVDTLFATVPQVVGKRIVLSAT